MKLLNIFLFIFNFISIILSYSLSENSLNFSFNIFSHNEIDNTSLSNNDSSTYNIIKDIFENNIYINIKLGSPPQSIKLIIDPNYDDFYIAKEDAKFNKQYPKRLGNFYYNESLSSSFSYQKDKEDLIYYSHPHLSRYVQDNFVFSSTNNEVIIKKLEFLLAYEVKEFEHGIIGLKGIFNNSRRLDFLSTLKKNNLTNNYIWYLKYNTSKSGNLIIGNYPHNDQNSIHSCNDCTFQKKHFVKKYSTYSEYSRAKSPWGVSFEKIFLKKDEEILKDCQKCHIAELDFNLGIIKGSKNYENILEESLFNKYIEQKLCFKDSFTINKNYEDSDYIFYYCNNSINNELKNEFKSIIFEDNFFKTNFSLDYNDLFFQKNDYIFCKIIFDNYYNWILGSPFLSKYLFILNSDSKEIGFYSKNIINNEEKKIGEDKNDYSILIKIVIIIFLSIILIAIGIFIGKQLFGAKRKVRMNELKENFEIQ
jgi:hypothetical protein